MSNLVSQNVNMIFKSPKGETVHALKDISFTLKKGELLTVLGPSGCGKTTLLNIAAGFLRPTSGNITLGDKEIDGPGVERGMVFQQGALFEWLTVAENVNFGLRMKKEDPVKTAQKVEEWLDIVGLKGFGNTPTYQLSGGMQQRVALARCLINDPDLILMDEPLGALDALTREKMQSLVLKIWKETGKTIILITHSVEEALLLGERVYVMAPRPGRIHKEYELPFANMGLNEDLREIKNNKDFVSKREEIIEAITKQLKTVDYAQPFQQGFGGSFELATKISKHTPGNLNRIFYTICGSTAVETAIKISVAYHKARGEGQRFRFVGRERAYHGMNIGATSVGGMVNNVKTFASVLMPGVVHMRHTHLPEHKFISGQPETGAELANDLERICANFGGENIAACIVEPVAGSTGTLVPPKGYLQRLREICDKHGILLIFDEVITGWGRMGSPFGAQEFGVTPDLMTMAKATTNGIVPMGVVACKEEIYDAIMDNAPKGTIELFHGYTYSGIPVSVAAALAVQEIFEKEDIFNRAKEMAPYFQEAIFSLKDIDVVENIRGYGMMAGIDMKMDKKPGVAGFTCFKHCYDAGVNFKATGDCLIIAPMFISEKKHIDEIIEKLRTGINNYAKSKKN